MVFFPFTNDYCYFSGQHFPGINRHLSVSDRSDESRKEKKNSVAESELERIRIRSRRAGAGELKFTVAAPGNERVGFDAAYE